MTDALMFVARRDFFSPHKEVRIPTTGLQLGQFSLGLVMRGTIEWRSKVKLRIPAVVFTAALSTTAMAQLPGTIKSIPPAQLRISGSNYQNESIELAVRLVCNLEGFPADAYYIRDSDSSVPRAVAYVCYGGPFLAGSSAYYGQPIVIHKAFVGGVYATAGSYFGIDPVRDGTTVPFADLSAISNAPTQCSLDTNSSVSYWTPYGVSLAAMNVWNCNTQATLFAVPDIGFSDLEPALFDLSKAGLVSVPENQQIHGVSVTISMRNALQNSQALSGRIPASCNGTASDSVSCLPTLSESEVAGLFTGRLNTFGKLVNSTDSTPIFLIRFTSASPIQKIAEIHFLNSHITTAQNFTSVFKAPSAGFTHAVASDAGCGNESSSPASSIVFSADTVEDAVDCLNRHNAGNRFAISMFPTHFRPNYIPSRLSNRLDNRFSPGYRFIKIGGALPTAANVIRGKYGFFSERVINYKSSSLIGPASDLFSVLNKALGDNTFLRVRNGEAVRWPDATVGEQFGGVVSPARVASCRATFSSLGTTPDSDPVSNASRSPAGVDVKNATKPALAICPTRF